MNTRTPCATPANRWATWLCTALALACILPVLAITVAGFLAGY